MSLSVGDALRDGLGRTFERNGLQLVAGFVALRAVSTVADDTLTRANLALADRLGTLPGTLPAPFPALAEAPTPYALPLGVAAAFALALGVALVAEAVRIVAVRTLVSERTDRIPRAFLARNLLPATVNGFVGGIVVLTLTVIGLVALVVPGVFVALSFFFVRQEIAVRDVNFVDAMAGSWALVGGSRLELFALAVAVVIAGFLASIPGFLVGLVSPSLGTAVGVVARAFVVVFGVASAARAYDQLRRADEPAADDAEPSYEGALTADDLPPPDAGDGQPPGGTREP